MEAATIIHSGKQLVTLIAGDSFPLPQRFLFFTILRTVLRLKYYYVLRSKALELTEWVRVPYLWKVRRGNTIISQQKSLPLFTGHLLCV
jgi:hypothetical protein